jgi:hypothetical protein
VKAARLASRQLASTFSERPQWVLRGCCNSVRTSNDQEINMAILADQDSNKKKGSAPETAAKGSVKSGTAKSKKTDGKTTTKQKK